MTAAEFRQALRDLGLSTAEVARIFDANPRTARRWADGKQDIPEDVAIWLKDQNEE